MRSALVDDTKMRALLHAVTVDAASAPPGHSRRDQAAYGVAPGSTTFVDGRLSARGDGADCRTTS